jgi:hypothetical protein
MNGVPRQVGAEFFNSKLILRNFTTTYFNMFAQAVVMSIPGNGQYIMPKLVLADRFTLFRPCNTALLENSGWMPPTNTGGTNVYVTVTSANNAAGMTQMIAGRSFGSWPMWIYDQATPFTVRIVEGPDEPILFKPKPGGVKKQEVGGTGEQGKKLAGAESTMEGN